jgi:hypothetical protein
MDVVGDTKRGDKHVTGHVCIFWQDEDLSYRGFAHLHQRRPCQEGKEER